MPLHIGKKKKKGNIIFFTEAKNSMLLKGKSRIHIKVDAQEIKESCTLPVSRKF